MTKSRFVLIGGFLGAGKTTLIGELARRYVADGKRVGIITNDQAADLVDTQNLRSQGFDVGEVAGACFCCSFDELVATADALSSAEIPDVLLAEPVGSCTDLVATIVLPMQQMLGDRFELAPFGVLLKPSHGRRILATPGDHPLSGFSPQAEYIFRKQLEEADYLMIGRSDQLSDEEIQHLTQSLAEVAAGIPVIAVSPKTGVGIEQALGYIESPLAAGSRLLDIDYDIYAAGEAELGWVNLTATFDSSEPVDLDNFVTALIGVIADDIIQTYHGAIAHLKASLLAGDTQAVANVVSNQSGVELGLQSGRKVAGPIQIIVNARVAIDPDDLQKVCESNVRKLVHNHQGNMRSLSAHCAPARPTDPDASRHGDELSGTTRFSPAPEISVEPRLLRRPLTPSACAKQIGLFVVNELFLDRIDRQLAAQNPGDRRGVAGDVGASHDVRVGCRLAARANAVEEIACVGRNIQPPYPLGGIGQ